jgi:hypothetical protein
MLEFIRHALGICGEHYHPNLFTLILGGLGSSPIFSYIYFKLKSYNESKSRSTYSIFRKKQSL